MEGRHHEYTTVTDVDQNSNSCHIDLEVNVNNNAASTTQRTGNSKKLDTSTNYKSIVNSPVKIVLVNMVNVLVDLTILISVFVISIYEEIINESDLFISCLLFLSSLILLLFATKIMKISQINRSNNGKNGNCNQREMYIKLMYVITVIIHSILLYAKNEIIESINGDLGYYDNNNNNTMALKWYLFVIKCAFLIKSIIFTIWFLIYFSIIILNKYKSYYINIIYITITIFSLISLAIILTYQFNSFIIILHLIIIKCNVYHSHSSSMGSDINFNNNTYVEDASKSCCGDDGSGCEIFGCDCAPAGCGINCNSGCCECKYDSEHWCMLRWCGFCECNGNSCCACPGESRYIPSNCCSWCGICSCYCCDPGGCLDCCCCSFDFFTWCCCDDCC